MAQWEDNFKIKSMKTRVYLLVFLFSMVFGTELYNVSFLVYHGLIGIKEGPIGNIFDINVIQLGLKFNRIC